MPHSTEELKPVSFLPGIFEEEFIEERRQGIESFINKIAGHPLAQNEKCLHMFLTEAVIGGRDKLIVLFNIKINWF